MDATGVGAAVGATLGAAVAAGATGAAVGAEAQPLSISPRTTIHETKITLFFISSSPLTLKDCFPYITPLIRF
jgi:hypothetical protein